MPSCSKPQLSMSAGRRVDSAGRRVRGRGTADACQSEDRYAGRAGNFESVESGDGAGPSKSVEGWIIFVSGLNEEINEEDVYDRFAEFGEIKQLNIPLDRRTGWKKGYALVEYEKKAEAQKAIETENGQELWENVMTVEWAFSKGPIQGRESTRRRTD